MSEFACKECTTDDCFLKSFGTRDKHIEKIDVICRSYHKGQELFTTIENLEGIVFVKSGKVMIKQEGAYRSQVVRLCKTGDTIGFIGQLKDRTYNAIALDEVKACWVGKRLFYSLLRSNSILGIRMMKYFIGELRSAEEHLSAMAVMTVQERVIYSLVLIGRTYGEEMDGKTHISWKFSRSDLAAVAGTYPEQISRTLTSLKEQNLISNHPAHGLLIDSAQLAKLLP